MSTRRLYFTPSGPVTVIVCRKRVFVRGRRKAVLYWSERFTTIDGWVVAVYAENDHLLWLYSALAGMWGSRSTGGLVHNLKGARDASVLYEVQWEGTGLKVALCDQDPAFEGGLSNLMEGYGQFLRGEIGMPPAIAKAREIRTACPDVQAIMLPASPMESNAMRLALVRVLLMRPEALDAVKPDQALSLRSPYRLFLRTARLRAPDRTASPQDPPGRKRWVAPPLAYFLARRRFAQAKDWLRRVLIQKPAESLSSVREFFADRPQESLGELLRSVGFLLRSLFEGWAMVLATLTFLIGALTRAGLL